MEKKESADLHLAEAYHTRLDGAADLAASASRVFAQAFRAKLDAKQCRVINSTMLFAADSPDDETMSPRQQTEFVATDRVSGTRGY